MQRSLQALVVLLLAAGLTYTGVAAMSGAGDAPAPQARVGAVAPDFTLHDLEGKAYTLSELQGKVVLVNFWATWCPPCRAEMPSMERLAQRFEGQDFVLLAINVEADGHQRVAAFLRDNPHSFPILLDASGEVQRQFGVYKFPETFIIRRDGVIADRVVGAIDWISPKAVNLINFLVNG